MLFGIRDDDISYWTNPEDIETVYKYLWSKNIKISFSVIPFAVQSFNMGNFDDFYQGDEPMPLHQNRKLVEYLREKLKSEQISIMLHGYTHQYKIKHNTKGFLLPTKENLELVKRGSKKIIWVGEYSWKSYEQLKRETKEGKEYLEDLFHTKITVFVPPSNDISKEGVKAVSECGLNISGTMYLSKFNRPVNFLSIKNWWLKFLWRILYNKVYPYVMNYGKHKELCAYSLVPGITLERLLSQYKFCQQKNAPFVLATHYWELNNKVDLKNILYLLVNYTLKLNNINYSTVDTIIK